ncbi:MFS transporter [Nocardia sp. NBC_00881]|uniref:MFS transporter n=1 Tax=Nocardia sp. NBC_00881 TaxID=2975995 RepID=UPI00387069FE|nr:MFS transporter [Nocardia sp. NBC_00881]
MQIDDDPIQTTTTADHPVRLTSTQRRAFWGSFGGWAMDGFNWTVFGLVLAPTMTALLPRAGIEPTAANIGWYGQISAALFLVGWGCSAIWGPIADRFGRKPAMTLSILIYGVFTALAGLATNLWEWNAFRFLAHFAVFTIWLPEQYPTRMRATAFAFTTTFSRWFAAAGTFLIGYGIHETGSLTIPLSATALVFVLGIGLVRAAPETRGVTLPD